MVTDVFMRPVNANEKTSGAASSEESSECPARGQSNICRLPDF